MSDYQTRYRVTRLIAVLVLVLTGVQAHAEARREAGGDQATQKLQYMLRQLSDEKASLQAENAKLSAELAEASRKLARAEKDYSVASNRLQQSRAANEGLVSRVKGDFEKHQDLLEQHRQSLQELRVEKKNVALLKSAVEERDMWIDRCKANNDELSRVNLDLVDRYRDKGFWQVLKQSDPLTGIGKVRLETIADDYRYRIEDLQVTRYEDNAGTVTQ
jgi:chromosome segregation ATPase